VCRQRDSTPFRHSIILDSSKDMALSHLFGILSPVELRIQMIRIIFVEKF
jgi:hypothetical protein